MEKSTECSGEMEHLILVSRALTAEVLVIECTVENQSC